MRSVRTWWIIAAIMLLLDFYVFQALKTVAQNASEKTRLVIFIGYWLISGATLALLLCFPYIQGLQTSKFFRNYIFAILIGLFLAKLIGAAIFLTDDLRRGAFMVVRMFYPNAGASIIGEGNGIPRSVFLSWLGLGIGGSLFGTLLVGFSNKYNYQVKRITLKYSNLPLAFRGMKLVHISDIHSGSLKEKEAVLKGIHLINQQKADLVLFTGDLVNDRATEMHDWMDVFSQINAPHGVYSTLGNHDYGDYVRWDTPEAKQQNLTDLKQVHANLGWRLLMNEHVRLEKENSFLTIVGIENWGAKARFPKYGKMDQAMKGVNEKDAIILMSHDPSHWEAQVIPEYPQVHLMLSGHTHGMQFGLENPYFKWSPVQWVYKQWAGVYKQADQQLYVNRGFGFLGYPGRVGIMPEITFIELA